MNDVLIFILGLVVTIPTVAAVILIGRSEAEDSVLTRTSDSKGAS